MTILSGLSGLRLCAENLSGNCGKNITWALDDDGVLTLTGQGDMPNFFKNDSIPWQGKNVVSVIVGDGITCIGARSFYGCSSLCSVNFGNTVKSVGNWAFEDCINLRDVKFPGSMKRIGYSSFEGCSGLSEIEISDSVISIGSRTFYGCSGLNVVKIGNSVTDIGHQTFENCSQLNTLTIGSAVRFIGKDVFYGCCELKEVNSLNPVPPETTLVESAHLFSNSAYETAQLNVPIGSLKSYRVIDAWDKVKNMKEKDFSGQDVVDRDAISVIAAKGEIIVSAAKEDLNMEIYDIRGRNVYHGAIGSIKVCSSGVYFVRVAGITNKVIVK